MEKIQFDDFAPEELLEYLYVAGLHNKARVIAEVMGFNDYFELLQRKYEYKQSEQSNLEQMDEEFYLIQGLTWQMRHLKFLRNIVISLPPRSNILEIGTYLGSSTLALLQGAKINDCKLTAIDVYSSFPDSRLNTSNSNECMHWEYLEWQNNVSKYSELVSSYHACSIPMLKHFISQQKKFDLIFLDTAHDLETQSELALISCLASENCLFVLDDVIDYNQEMTSAWLTSLKYSFSFPQFFDSKYALARPKNSPLPLNFKANSAELFNSISEIVSIIEFKKSIGCTFAVEPIGGCLSGFTIMINDNSVIDD